jgi:transposase
MSRSTRYSPELRERAVRMVSDKREDYSSEWACMTAVSKLFGMSPETLRSWVRRAQVDGGTRPGLSTDERARLRELEREVKDLRRANAILKDASVFFATELDGQTKR